MKEHTELSKSRAEFSKNKLKELRESLEELEEIKNFPKLSILAVGSYGRFEASKYSDIDLFFLIDGSINDIINPNTKSLQIFGKLIQIAEEIGFPEFSNDCEYLSFLPSDSMLENLGDPVDDYKNYFTARMLMILESKCLINEDRFDKIAQDIIGAYFRDYPDHPNSFQPTFLINDVCRYWNTLLLNYENRRNDLITGDLNIPHKVRNFKLKFSRLMTCHATIAALGSYSTPVEIKDILELIKLTPRERLVSVYERLPEVENSIKDLLNEYDWFLEQTGLPKDDLHQLFVNEKHRKKMFKRANKFGSMMFNVHQTIDENNSNHDLLRYLVC